MILSLQIFHLLLLKFNEFQINDFEFDLEFGVYNGFEKLKCLKKLPKVGEGWEISSA